MKDWKNFFKFPAVLGFTLVELMTTVAIIGIISSLALPEYNLFRAKAKSVEGKIKLANLFTTMEGFFADWDSYTTCMANLGFPARSAGIYSFGFENNSIPDIPGAPNCVDASNNGAHVDASTGMPLVANIEPWTIRPSDLLDNFVMAPTYAFLPDGPEPSTGPSTGPSTDSPGPSSGMYDANDFDVVVAETVSLISKSCTGTNGNSFAALAVGNPYGSGGSINAVPALSYILQVTTTGQKNIVVATAPSICPLP